MATATCPHCSALLEFRVSDDPFMSCPTCGEHFPRPMPVAVSATPLVPPPVRRAAAEPPVEDSPEPTHCVGCNKPLHNVLHCHRCQLHFCSEICLRRHYKATWHNVAQRESEPVRPAGPALKTAIGAVLVFGVVALLAFFVLRGKDGGGQEKPLMRSGLPASKDPYPQDCAIIRNWLKQNEGQVEIVSWGQRITTNNPVIGGRSTLTARWRRAGESKVKRGLFAIGPGDTVEWSSVTD